MISQAKPTKFIPRDYQTRTLSEARSTVASGVRSFIIEAPTGSGKTFIASLLIDSAVAKGSRVLFLAPRRELIFQCSDHLLQFGVPHGLILRGEAAVHHAPVYVASKDTLASRAIRSARTGLPACDLCIVDECHISMAPEWRKLLGKLREKNPNMVLVGLSATPARGDGKGLGDVYGRIIHAASYAELISEGYLVPTRVFAPDVPDMNGVKAKDWDDEAERRMDKPKLVGDVFEHWSRLAGSGEGMRPTVIFASGVQHSLHIRDEFLMHGVRIRHLDGNTPIDERDQIVGELHRGSLDAVTNCDVLSVGWDCPRVSCCVLAAPTRSLVKYRQRCGRTLRPYPGKQDCLLIDHSGAVLMHGFPDEDLPWDLETTQSLEKVREKKRSEGTEKVASVCPKCHSVFSDCAVCPSCGYTYVQKGREVAIQHGLLKEVNRKKLPTRVEKEAYWTDCLNQAIDHDWHCGAAAHKYKAVMGCWPRGFAEMPSGREWKLPARDVFPQYCKQRAFF